MADGWPAGLHTAVLSAASGICCRAIHSWLCIMCLKASHNVHRLQLALLLLLLVYAQVGGVIAGALYIAIEEMQFPGGGPKGGGLFVG